MTFPAARLPLYLHNQPVGTLPANYTPDMQRPSLMYVPRAGDFVRSARGWEADRSVEGLLRYVTGFLGEMR